MQYRYCRLLSQPLRRASFILVDETQLEPKDRELPGIVMEFKAVTSGEDRALSDLAKEALDQIEDKAYYTDMKDWGITDIVRYGIAFSGKNVEVKIIK